MRIVYMGTPDFAVPSLKILLNHGYRPHTVVTAPDRKRGRGQKWSPTPVKRVANQAGIPVLQPDSVKDPAFASQIQSLEPDLIVVVAFRILPRSVFTTAKLGAFNLHASLLPAFRGAAPIQHAIMAGVDETGVTTFFLKEKVDTGNMILQKRIPVGPDENAGELHDRLMHLGAEAVLETVQMIEAGTVASMPQDDSLASPAPKIFNEQAEINWNQSARNVHNHIRALSPYPGAWTVHGDTLLKVYQSRPVHGEGRAGAVIETENRLIVACGTDALELLDIQREGRRRMHAEEFLRGYPLEKRQILGA